MDRLKTVSIVKQSGVKVMLVTDETELSELLTVIEQAIRGSGFNPKGELDFVEE